jgi:hypothetical protein
VDPRFGRKSPVCYLAITPGLGGAHVTYGAAEALHRERGDVGLLVQQIEVDVVEPVAGLVLTFSPS